LGKEKKKENKRKESVKLTYSSHWSCACQPGCGMDYAVECHLRMAGQQPPRYTHCPGEVGMMLTTLRRTEEQGGAEGAQCL